MKDICKNCGGWKGLHHFETDQCPVGGVEAPIGKRQEWKTTTFEQEDDRADEIATLRRQLAEARKIMQPFTHADLVRELSGNQEGAESPIFGRGEALLKLGHFQAAAEWLKSNPNQLGE